jgi:hypothetical protein
MGHSKLKKSLPIRMDLQPIWAQSNNFIWKYHVHCSLLHSWCSYTKPAPTFCQDSRWTGFGSEAAEEDIKCLQDCFLPFWSSPI